MKLSTYCGHCNAFANVNSFRTLSGSAKLPLCRGANIARILPRHSRRQGHGAVVEKVNLQGHLTHGRSRAGIFQIAKLSGAIGVEWSHSHLCVYNNPQQQLEEMK